MKRSRRGSRESKEVNPSFDSNSMSSLSTSRVRLYLWRAFLHQDPLQSRSPIMDVSNMPNQGILNKNLVEKWQSSIEDVAAANENLVGPR
jgi:hypothetical protein